MKSDVKESILENVDISHNSDLISPIISELHRVIRKREPSLSFPNTGGRMRLSNYFQKLQQVGKATTEEVEAIDELEKAFDNLSKPIQRLDSTPSLRSGMRL